MIKIITKAEVLKGALSRYKDYHSVRGRMDIGAALDPSAVEDDANDGEVENTLEYATKLAPSIADRIRRLEELGDNITEAEFIDITKETKWTALLCDETHEDCETVVQFTDGSQYSLPVITKAYNLFPQ